MDIKRIKKPLTLFIKSIPKEIKVDEVIIFGSYLEGTATSDSDIDVIVVSDNFKQMTEDQKLLKLHRAARFIDPVIEPWGFTKKELQRAKKFSTLNYIFENGYRFTLPRSAVSY